MSQRFYLVTGQDLDRAIRQILAHADYDLLKAYECGEETGEDTIHELVAIAETELAEQVVAS